MADLKFYSHINPYKLIFTHANEVDLFAKEVLGEEYDEENKILSCCHDFGKYTTYFQDYLIGKDKSKNRNNSHSFISAIFASYIALDKFGEDNILPLIIFNCILHHHGSLKNASIDLPKSLKGITIKDSAFLIDKIDTCKKQIENIKKNRNAIYEDYNNFGYGDYFNNFIDEVPIENILKKLKKIDYKFAKKSEESGTYFKHQLLYSILIAGDKLSASNTIRPVELRESYKKLNNNKNKKFRGIKGRINEIRCEIFNNIQQSLEKNYKQTKLFSITSPTGTGKTYSGFFAALKLRELLGDDRKIIYSLPFTSIINQNYEAIYDLFHDTKDFKSKSSQYIIKHHSMADVEYSSENENYEIMQAELLLENWNSGIVVTTFVQLLQTLIGNKNRMLKKFNAIKGSIILLDEVQAIDMKYFSLVDNILESAAQYLDCRIIMMTATRPLILQDAYELLENNRTYFKCFSRTKLIPKLNPISIEEFTEQFVENIEEKSYLIICNTINQSLNIYKNLSNLDREVYYLSTNLLPIHRNERIDIIREKLKKGEKPILVSTQVVEAGVDFDFDTVIRDIAPLDSIIQAAGRCNRNNRKDSDGEVFIYSMIDENERYYGNYVYGLTSISITKEILTEYDIIHESEYMDLTEKYFIGVNKNINSDASSKFINSVNKLLFNKADKVENENYTLDNFSLIKDNYNYIDVFFRYDDKAECVFNLFMDALSESDKNRRNEKLLLIKNEVRNYILSLPAKFRERFDIDKNTVVINLPMEGCNDFYDYNTGFIRSEQDDFLII